MNKVKIIMIDSGISKEQIEQLDPSLDINKSIDKYYDFFNHGSAVFSVLQSYGFEVEPLKISNDIDIFESDLIIALEKVLSKKSLINTILNISLGITNCVQKNVLYNLCKKITKRGCIIISAFDNNGAFSYPAAFDCVIGVDTTIKCKKVTHYEYVDDFIINVRGFGGTQVLLNNNSIQEKFIGSSFVTPHITGIVAKQMSFASMSFNEVLKFLRNNATKVFHQKKYVKNHCFDKIKIRKAIVLPLNKEIITILRNTELLSFEIIDVYDFHYMRTVNKYLSEFSGEDIKKDLIIKNITSINWEDDFDTIIMGHMYEINETLHKDYTSYFINKALEHNKFVYSFDNLKNNKLIKNNKNIFFPYINKNNVPCNRFGKLFQIHCPILGVFGTSSKQGKFSLQLNLRKKFMENNFNIAQLSTEPSGLLFGMDAIYPMGYGNNIEIDGYDEITVINNVINQIVTDDTHILLLGSQSQTVAYSSQNMSLFPLGNANLLLATFPDIIILCINCFDDIEYIKRTVRYLEGVVDSKVIAVVIAPFIREYTGSTLIRTIDIASKNELDTLKVIIKKELNIPSYFLNDDNDLSDLYNLCIDILS